LELFEIFYSLKERESLAVRMNKQGGAFPENINKSESCQPRSRDSKEDGEQKQIISKGQSSGSIFT